MEALKLRSLLLAVLALASNGKVHGAGTYQTVNFAVTADRPEVAEKVGKEAEVYRRQLAVFWIGKPLPNWSRPCRISVREGAIGAGGQTTFQFVRGEVLNWRMQVQGTLERILDSVLPHEINHTIFACHFRRPLPRWADEGAATLFEHRSEQLKQLALLNEVIRNKHEVISLRDLLSMKEYPQGTRPMLTLYAQGYALADFLVQQKGRHAYLKFISDGERGGWEQAIRNNFDHEGIESLEKNWRGWVLAGMPKLTLPREQMLAANENDADSKAQAAARPELPLPGKAPPVSSRKRPPAGAVVRSQSPDREKAAMTHSGHDATNSSSGTRRSDARLERRSATTESARPSVEAPLPQRKGVPAASQNPRIQPAKSGESQESFFEELNTQSTSESNSRSKDSEATEVAKLEPTAMKTEEEDSEGRRRSEMRSGEFEFNGMNLPRERSAGSGSTPQWAGFPGMKKSF